MSLIQIQETYIEAVNSAIARWDHRPEGGHSRRCIRGAYTRAVRILARKGYTTAQIELIIADADDMALLERIAD